MATCISHSPEETAALGAAWGSTAQPGLVIALCGDLGAGKTQLVKGLASGLGIVERVHSPTFALLNTYRGGRLTLFHLDLYRLETPDQVVAAGLEESLRPSGVAVVEWAERLLPPGSSKPEFKSGMPANLPQFFKRPSNPSALNSAPGVLRWVKIETLEPTERRIAYEDFGG